MSYQLYRVDLEGQFGVPPWTDSQIKTYPRHGAIPDTITDIAEFVVIGITPITSSREAFGGKRLNTGLFYVEIYNQNGKGDKRIYEIADQLDLILQNKVFNNRTQTGTSYIQSITVDDNNPNLVKGLYVVPFDAHD